MWFLFVLFCFSFQGRICPEFSVYFWCDTVVGSKMSYFVLFCIRTDCEWEIRLSYSWACNRNMFSHLKNVFEMGKIHVLILYMLLNVMYQSLSAHCSTAWPVILILKIRCCKTTCMRCGKLSCSDFKDAVHAELFLKMIWLNWICIYLLTF